MYLAVTSDLRLEQTDEEIQRNVLQQVDRVDEAYRSGGQVRWTGEVGGYKHLKVRYKIYGDEA